MTPTNGVDRCDCGCKYWVKRIVGRKVKVTCFDCGARFSPPEPDPVPCLDSATDAELMAEVRRRFGNIG